MKRENAAKRYYKKNMIIFLAVSIPLTVIVLLIALAFIAQYGKHGYSLLYMPIMMAVAFIPFDIYYIVKYIHYKNVEFIDIRNGQVIDCESRNYGRYGTYVGFIVELEDEERPRKIITKHCHNKADGYLGSIVTVGQDPSNGEWIILE